MNLRFLHLAATLIAIAQCSFAMERISVKENQFVTSDGQPIIFRGLSTSEPSVLRSRGMWTPEYFREMKKWGANIVRFPVHPAAWREQGEEAYLGMLDQGVAMARANDMHVIIDWHSIGNLVGGRFFRGEGGKTGGAYDTTIDETFAFWKAIAARYRDEPTVAFFELYNEPALGPDLGDASWDEWRRLMERLIQSIRQEGGKAVPLVAGFDFAYDLTPVADDPIREPQVGYVSHPYPGKVAEPARWQSQWTRDWGNTAKRYPVILTEVGFQYADDTDGYDPIVGDERYVEAITSYCDAAKVSYVVWCFDDRWVPRLFSGTDFVPTRAGDHFRRAILKANAKSNPKRSSQEQVTR